MRLFIASFAFVACLPFLTACDLLLGGAECSADSDCSGDDLCDNGECVECENDRDCDDDEECNDGECDRADNGSEGEGEGEEGEGEGEGEGGEGEGEGGSCDAETFAASCDGDVITLCGADNTVTSLNCSSEFYQGADGNPVVEPTITCVEPAALGSVPGPLRAQCWGEGAGAVCQGTIGLMRDGAEALLIGCDSGFACTLTAAGEACAASPTTCSDTGTSCDGNLLVACLFGGDSFTFADPLVADCTALGGTCQSDGTNAACVIDTDGLCSIGGFVAQCNTGLTCTPDPAAPGLGTCTGG